MSVGGLNTGEEPSDVLHVKADAVNGAGALDLSAVGAAGSAESELLPVSAEDGVVAFETEGFSVFIGATKGAPLRGAKVSGECGDHLTWTLDENGTLTISKTGEGTGAMWGAQEWIYQRDDILIVDIKDGVTSIGDNAFSDCGSLGSITIPSGVTSIGYSAFSECDSLQSIEIPASVTSIGAQAFYGCGSLQSIEIPASVTSIGDNAFEDCSSLTSVTFTGVSQLTSIGDNAFSDCDDLKDIWYHGTEAQWKKICSNNGGAPDATVHYVLSITAASDPAEGGTVTISPNPDGDLPGTYKPDTLVTVTATANSNYAFVNWTWIEGTETKTSTENPFTFTATTDRDLVANFAQAQIVASGACGDNLTWTLYDNGTLTISGTGVMYDRQVCSSNLGDIKSVVIENGATNIGSNAFSYCDSLKSIEIPKSVTGIDNYAFFSCRYLGRVTFATGSALEVIGDHAFASCESLTSIAIPSSVTSIEAGAFLNCGNLTSVTFADGSQLELIGDSAFVGSGLESIEIPSRVTKIGTGAFLNCGNLTSVTFAPGSQLASIGASAFYRCSSLRSIEIPSGVTSIGDDAFNGCGDLSEITVDSWKAHIKEPEASWNGSIPVNWLWAKVTATANPDAGGMVSITGDTDGDGSVELEKSKNTSVTVTATPTPNSSYSFVNWTWTEDSETKSSTDNPFTFTVTADRDLVANFTYITAPTITAQPGNLSWTYGETATQKLSVTARVDVGTLSYQWYQNTSASATGGTAITGATDTSYTIPSGTQTNADTYYYYCVVTNTKNGATASTASNTATVTVDKAQLTITAQDQNYIYNGQTQGEGDTIYKEQAVIAEKITVGEGQLKGTDTVTSVTIDGQGKDPDTYDLTASAVAIGLNGNKTANYAISYVKGKLTILPPAVAEINVTKVLEGRNWKDGDSFTFNLAAVTEGAPMPAKDTATATKDARMANFGEVTYYSVGTFEYTITESKGSLDGVSYDTAPHTVLVTVAQSDPKQAPTATVAYDGQDSLTITNTFTPATAVLKVTKSLNPWRAGDSFTFTLAPEGNAPMPANNTTATATEQNTTATFDEIEYETAGTYKYTITERNGGADGVTYDTTPHNVVVTVSKDSTTNALTASVKYDGDKDSLTVKNTLIEYTIKDSSADLTINPNPATVGDTVTLTSIKTGYEIKELEVVYTDGSSAGKTVVPEQDPDKPNVYSFKMLAGNAIVTVTFEEILYRVVEGADSSWLKGSNGDLSIRVKRDPKDTSFEHFRKGGTVAIDGIDLSEDSSALIQKDYKAEEGSTVITLHKKMLNRLSAGKHTVTITFDDGSVSTGLTILVPAGGYSPGTGDSARIGFWAALMVLAGLGFAGADYARRKFRRPRYVGKHM